MTRLRLAAIVGLALIGAWLVRPLFRMDHPDPAIENGYKAARSAIRHRQLAAIALVLLDSARDETDETVRNGQVRVAPDTEFVGIPVVVEDGRPVIGPHLPTDTLMALPQVRVELLALRDTARVVIADIQGAILIERGRSSLAIQHLEAALLAKDTVEIGLRAELKQKTRPFYVRALRGVEHMGVGLACGGAGYVLGGPLAGVGAAVLCAAIDGARR